MFGLRTLVLEGNMYNHSCHAEYLHGHVHRFAGDATYDKEGSSCSRTRNQILKHLGVNKLSTASLLTAKTFQGFFGHQPFTAFLPHGERRDALRGRRASFVWHLSLLISTLTAGRFAKFLSLRRATRTGELRLLATLGSRGSRFVLVHAGFAFCKFVSRPVFFLPLTSIRML